MVTHCYVAKITAQGLTIVCLGCINWCMSKDAPFPTLQEVEELHIRAAYERTGGNATQAAKLLGIDRRTFYRRAHQIGLERPNRPVLLNAAWSDPKALRRRLADLEGK